MLGHSKGAKERVREACLAQRDVEVCFITLAKCNACLQPLSISLRSEHTSSERRCYENGTRPIDNLSSVNPDIITTVSISVLLCFFQHLFLQNTIPLLFSPILHIWTWSIFTFLALLGDVILSFPLSLCPFLLINNPPCFHLPQISH